jgi:hypothetical protein
MMSFFTVAGMISNAFLNFLIYFPGGAAAATTTACFVLG